MKLVRLLLLLPILLLALVPVGVWAAIGNPNSIAIGDAFVFRNVVETGDQLWYLRYDISYTVKPSELASDSYLMAIYAADGVTLLFTRPVYDFDNNGVASLRYEDDIGSIYLTAAQALTWNGAYVVRITGNPGVFPVLIEGVNMRSRTLGAGDYYEQSQLDTILINQMVTLEAITGVNLVGSTTLVTSTGGIWLNGAIPGIYSMAPDIFETTISTPAMADVVGNMSLLQDYELLRPNRVVLMRQAIGSMLGTTENWGGFALTAFFGLLFAYVALIVTKGDGTAAIAAGVLAVPLGGVLGFISLGVWIIVFIVTAFVFGVLYLLGRIST